MIRSYEYAVETAETVRPPRKKEPEWISSVRGFALATNMDEPKLNHKGGETIGASRGAPV